MNISREVLAQYISLPESNKALRELLDDIGIEVKRISDDGQLGVELLANRGEESIGDSDPFSKNYIGFRSSVANSNYLA